MVVGRRDDGVREPELRPQTATDLDDVVVKKPDGIQGHEPDPRVAVVDHARASVKLMPLLNRRVVVHGIDVAGLRAPRGRGGEDREERGGVSRDVVERYENLAAAEAVSETPDAAAGADTPTEG
ncbi:MAG: hypothetical protein EBY79_03520 [Actinobacteria bacterium]|nr:hypothetical protein [Actinomycetota bacterium]